MTRTKIKSTKIARHEKVELKVSGVVEHDQPRYHLAPAKVCKELPSVERIAIIAATLARNIDGGTPESLVKFAMKLWHEAREQIITASERLDQGLAIFDESDPPEWKIFLQRFHKFPITSDQFLKTVLSQLKNRTAKLTQIGKTYVSSCLREAIGKTPTTEEIDKAYSNWPRCENEDDANKEAKRFLTWYQNRISEDRRSAGLRSVQSKAEAAEAAGMRLKK